MNEVESEEYPIDHAALQSIGVVLRKTTSASSLPRNSVSAEYAEESLSDDGIGGPRYGKVEVEEVEDEEEDVRPYGEDEEE